MIFFAVNIYSEQPRNHLNLETDKTNVNLLSGEPVSVRPMLILNTH